MPPSQRGKKLPDIIHLMTPKQIAIRFGLSETTLKQLRDQKKGLRFITFKYQTYYILEEWVEHYSTLQSIKLTQPT